MIPEVCILTYISHDWNNTHTHKHTHTNTHLNTYTYLPPPHTHTHVHTYKHTHTLSLPLSLYSSVCKIKEIVFKMTNRKREKERERGSIWCKIPCHRILNCVNILSCNTFISTLVFDPGETRESTDTKGGPFTATRTLHSTEPRLSPSSPSQHLPGKAGQKSTHVDREAFAAT